MNTGEFASICALEKCKINKFALDREFFSIELENSFLSLSVVFS